MAWPALPVTPTTDAMLTTRPLFCLAMTLVAAWVARKTPVRLVLMTSFHWGGERGKGGGWRVVVVVVENVKPKT